MIRTLYCDMWHAGVQTCDVKTKWSNIAPPAEKMRERIFRTEEKVSTRIYLRKRNKWAKHFETPQLRTYSWQITPKLREIFREMGLISEMPIIEKATTVDVVFAKSRVEGAYTNKMLDKIRKAFMPYTVSGSGVLIFKIPDNK